MTLNEIIYVYRKVQVKDEYGTLTTTQDLFKKVYAKVRPLSGMERNRSDQTEAAANYRFWIHQRSDLLPDDIIQWNSVQYNIRFIADNGPKEAYMYIDAQRGVAV